MIGYEHAPITQLVSVVTLICSLLFGGESKSLQDGNYCSILSTLIVIKNWMSEVVAANIFGLDIGRLCFHGELWRLLTSQIVFNQNAQALVGLILLYTCRQFERQMGSRKFAGFLFLSLCFSVLSLLAVVVQYCCIPMFLFNLQIDIKI